MFNKISSQHRETFEKIRVLSNEHRFKIVEITQEIGFTVTQLSSMLNLSYTKCADYVSLLEKKKLVDKIKRGREIIVKSKVKLHKDKIEF